MENVLVQIQLLLCPICKNRLDENCKTFPCRCQPSYCRTCLRRMLEEERSLKCSTCGKKFSGIDLIDTLPSDLTLLHIIQHSKGNTFNSWMDNAAIQAAAMAKSSKDLLDKLKKRNEELCARLDTGNSTSNFLLKNAQQTTSHGSKDVEIFKREIQNSRSDKEKFEFQGAILKFELELSRIILLLNTVEWNKEVKKEVRNDLEKLKRTEVAQNHDSIQKHLRDLLESLGVDEK